MKAIGKAPHARFILVQTVGEAVIGDDRWNGGKQANGGGK